MAKNNPQKVKNQNWKGVTRTQVAKTSRDLLQRDWNRFWLWLISNRRPR